MLALPEQDRELIADILFQSVAGPDLSDLGHEAWMSELDRRFEEVQSGRAKTISWDEVKASARASLHGAA